MECGYLLKPHTPASPVYVRASAAPTAVQSGQAMGHHHNQPTYSSDCSIRDLGCTMLAKPAGDEHHLSLLRQQSGRDGMGFSDPELQKKVFGPRWQHELEKQSWPLWKKLIHRFQSCPFCRPKSPTRKVQ